MVDKEHINKIKRRYVGLKKERETYEADWRLCCDFILPRRGRFWDQGDQVQGGRKDNKILDPTPTLAARVLAAGMQGGMASPSRPWFKLGFPDPDMNQHRPFKEYLEKVETAFYRVFAKSNFYQAINLQYLEQGGFGTGSMLIEEDYKHILRCRMFSTGEYYVALDDMYRVNTLYRLVMLTTYQAVSRYKEKCSTELQARAERSPDDYVKILHVLQPRNTFDPTKIDDLNAPFESIVMEMDRDFNVLEESGYFSWPAPTARWTTVGPEPYGGSPGKDSIRQSQLLQEMTKSQVKAIHLELNPPLSAPQAMIDKRMVNAVPGGLTADAGDGNQAVKPLYQISHNLRDSSAKIAEVQQMIREVFHNPLFTAILQEGKQMTAEEVGRRYEEKLGQLGPVIERQHSELFDPIFERTLDILQRNDLLPPLPPELEGMDLKVEYISLLAQAQKLVNTQSIESTAAFAASLSERWPEVSDKFNPDKAFDKFAEAVGAPVDCLRSDDEVKAIREERARAMQIEQDKAAMQEALSAGESLSNMEMEGMNGLTQVKEELEAGLEQ